MRKVTITATETASRRTKNRIAENGPVFKVVQEGAFPVSMNGRESHNVRSDSTKWFGWFLASDVEMVDVEEEADEAEEAK